MNKTNLDFLVTEVPNVIKYLDDVHNSEIGELKYLARMRSRNMYSAGVALISLAKASNMNKCVIVKDQYNQWLKVHPVLKTLGKVKDYGGTWETIIREISAKV